MRKKTSTSLLLGVLTVSLTAAPCYASATQKKLSAAQNSQQENQKQLENAQGRIDSLEAKKGDLEGYLKELNQQLNELGENLQEIQAQSEEKQKALEGLEKDLEAAREKEAEQYEKMKLRIQYMYENVDSSYLVMLMESRDLAEMLSKAETMSQLTDYDRKMLVEYKEVTQEIQEKEEDVKKEQKRLQKLEQESLDKQDEISTVVKSTHSQIETYEKQISAEEGNARKLLTQIEKQRNTIDVLIKEQKDREAAETIKKEQQAQNSGTGSSGKAEEQESAPSQKPSAPAQDSGNQVQTEQPSKDETPQEPEVSENNESSQKYLGSFRLTAYCNGPCCGGHSSGLTASGTSPVQGRTVAMGGVPFGTKLLINGNVYTVEDRGVPYGHVDIFFNSHEEALQFGSTYADVYQVN